MFLMVNYNAIDTFHIVKTYINVIKYIVWDNEQNIVIIYKKLDRYIIMMV